MAWYEHSLLLYRVVRSLVLYSVVALFYKGAFPVHENTLVVSSKSSFPSATPLGHTVGSAWTWCTSLRLLQIAWTLGPELDCVPEKGTPGPEAGIKELVRKGRSQQIL